jgi:hypothetical protein
MTTEILERDNREVTKLSGTERDQVAGEHHGSGAFAWAMIGALGAVVGATIVAIMFF